MNRSKELHKLFKEYILRSAEESASRSSGYGYSPLACRGGFNGGMTSSGSNIQHSIGIIYFYEWSDTSNLPKTFFTVDAFSRFLQSCGITLQGYEREIIEALHVSFISCKKGEKKLIIKKDYRDLSKELGMDKRNNVSLGSGIVSPQVSHMASRSFAPVPNNNWFG